MKKYFLISAFILISGVCSKLYCAETIYLDYGTLYDVAKSTNYQVNVTSIAVTTAPVLLTPGQRIFCNLGTSDIWVSASSSTNVRTIGWLLKSGQTYIEDKICSPIYFQSDTTTNKLSIQQQTSNY